MTDVVQYNEPAQSELEQWARDAHMISVVAVNLVKTSFVPESYKGDAAQVVAAILTGQEVGLKPMAALRSMDIIQGVPAMRAIAMRALVQSHGHEMWTVESTATQCIVMGQRKGSDKVEKSTWTMARAEKLNLHNKPNWKTQPISMLLARATSECARLIAADVLLGVPYSVEEIEDLGPEVPADAPRKASASRTAKRAPLPASSYDEPPLEGEQRALSAPVTVEAAKGADAAKKVVTPRPEPGEMTEAEYEAWSAEQADAERAKAAVKVTKPQSSPRDEHAPPLDDEPPLEWER